MALDDSSPLALDPAVMRELGYRTVDMLVDRMTGPAGPVVRSATPEQLHERLAMPPPEHAVGFEEILGGLERDVLPFVARISHPGYLAFIPGEGTWPGALGDLIGSALNLDTCWWLGSSGPSALELVVLDWFRQWVGYPEESAGVLVSGGSAANLTALACAREARMGAMDDRAVVYMSDQTHSSVARAARALGFRPDQVRVIPTDPRARMRPDALRGAIAADRVDGRRPLMVVANAGSTAAGAVDPLEELSEICRGEAIWLHVDGAYGAFACLSERGREVLAGMELADSITLDPHKWLYQPIELGALLVRDGSALRDAALKSRPPISRTSRPSIARSTSRTSACSSLARAARSSSGSRCATSEWPRSGRRSTAVSTWRCTLRARSRRRASWSSCRRPLSGW